MIQRFSTSIESDLLERFDRSLVGRQYATRSEAVRDLIRKALIEKEWEAGEEVVGVVTLVFDHHRARLQDRITEIQHAFHDLVISTTHVHLDHDNCLEVIIVKGRSESVRTMADQLTAVRGVKSGDLTAASTGVRLS
jgi:CopG family transcriptional regulator, nickel-responsive regulator